MMPFVKTSKNFGLYIHWPFCEFKCPYCDFNSHVRESIEEKIWEDAFLKEMAYVGQQSAGRTLTSVFFGGGTPSLMSAQMVQNILEALSLYWTLDPHIEITLEGNPNSIEVQKYKDFKKAGINRVSVGIQSLQQESLTFLGRIHTAYEAKQALDITKTLFDRSSFDLIYALPNQTLNQWQEELTSALDLAQGHVSLYQLIIEPGTAFYTRHQRGEFQLPPEDECAKMYDLTREIMSQQGYKDYEVSNYAKHGQECRHNLLYWHYEDYVCIGPGSHGRLSYPGHKKIALKNYKVPETWLEKVKTQGHGQELYEDLTKTDQLMEHLLMGLRLKTGISKHDFNLMHGVALQNILNPEKVSLLKGLGFCQENDTHFWVTTTGMLRLDKIISELVISL